MTVQEAAQLMRLYSQFWKVEGNLKDKLTAWAVVLADTDYTAAMSAVNKLAKESKWPPAVSEIVEAAQPYQSRKLLAETGMTGDWLRDGCIRNARKIMRQEFPIKRVM